MSMSFTKSRLVVKKLPFFTKKHVLTEYFVNFGRGFYYSKSKFLSEVPTSRYKIILK